MSGWGTQDLLAQLKRMPAYLGDKVIVLDDVDDGLLLHFYETCSFAVFPSYYEGWGLAATEAMAFGKACLIADAGGLEEAVQGLMPKLHPRDFPGWKKSIEEMIDNDAYRSKLEEKVSTSFKHRTWNDFSIDFVGQLLNQETTASKASNQNIW